MENTLIVYKPVGVTPLEMVRQVKKAYTHLRDVKVGYAGRLDPMAEGLLLLLIGDENKKKHKYEQLDKQYECEALLGVSTDSYDVLGLVQNSNVGKLSPDTEKKITSFFKGAIGPGQQAYPPYSSFRVKGKPLFYWARENKLSEIQIPSHPITVFEIKIQKLQQVLPEDIKSTVFNKLRSLDSGNFRKDEVKKSWEAFFQGSKKSTPLLLVSFRVHCSSGTYIRSLVHDLGNFVSTGAICFSLKRVRIGPYTHRDVQELPHN